MAKRKNYIECILIVTGLILSYDVIWWWNWVDYKISIVPVVGILLLILGIVSNIDFYKSGIWKKYSIIVGITAVLFIVFWGINEMATGVIRVSAIEEIWNNCYNSETAVAPQEYMWFKRLVSGFCICGYVSHFLMCIVIVLAIGREIFTYSKSFAPKLWVYLTSILLLISKLFNLVELKYSVQLFNFAKEQRGIFELLYSNRFVIINVINWAGICSISVLILYRCYIRQKSSLK